LTIDILLQKKEPRSDEVPLERNTIPAVITAGQKKHAGRAACAVCFRNQDSNDFIPNDFAA
jgi:hypothetical protein